MVNQGIDCTAVNGTRYNELTKDESLTERIFAGSVDAETEPRINALLEFATKLSQGPSEATRADVGRLIENGLSMGEVLDLVLSASLFGWANRLMHVLGDPLPQE